MFADRYFGFLPLHKKANKVLQRWCVLAFYRIASCLSGIFFRELQAPEDLKYVSYIFKMTG